MIIDVVHHNRRIGRQIRRRTQVVNETIVALPREQVAYGCILVRAPALVVRHAHKLDRVLCRNVAINGFWISGIRDRAAPFRIVGSLRPCDRVPNRAGIEREMLARLLAVPCDVLFIAVVNQPERIGQRCFLEYLIGIGVVANVIRDVLLVVPILQHARAIMGEPLARVVGVAQDLIELEERQAGIAVLGHWLRASQPLQNGVDFVLIRCGWHIPFFHAGEKLAAMNSAFIHRGTLRKKIGHG